MSGNYKKPMGKRTYKKLRKCGASESNVNSCRELVKAKRKSLENGKRSEKEIPFNQSLDLLSDLCLSDR